MAWVPARSCRAAFEAFEAWQTAGLNVLNNIGQWLECLLEAAEQRFRHLRPDKRQAWTPLATEGSGLSACSKLPRAFEAFEAWQTAGLNALNNRGQWPECLLEAAAQRFRWQTAGLNALNNRGQWPECLLAAGLNALNNRGQWPECLAEGKVVASQQKQAPHLRWSQAPPLPWRRPGSADFNFQLLAIF